MTTKPTLDDETREQLWLDPDWRCPHCEALNKAIREKCRMCGYLGGEFAIQEIRRFEFDDLTARMCWRDRLTFQWSRFRFRLALLIGGKEFDDFIFK